MGRASSRDPDVDDLARSLHQIEAEYRTDLDALLMSRLTTVLERRCPLRTVGAAPVRGNARLGFGNGLSVIARCEESGGMVRLAMALHKRLTVLIWQVDQRPHGVRLTLVWPPRHRIHAIVTGFDQMD